MQCVTSIRIRFQAWDHKMVLGQGVLNFFQLCGLTAQIFLEIIFVNSVPLVLKKLVDIGPRF